MIPKVIHYCWFGHNPKSDLINRCIRSWKKYCPEYEIREWNEDNFDIHVNQYVEQAYAAKKWAFVTDFARLWIIYHEGGIYLDTDVELLKSPDPLLAEKAYFGFEDTGTINTGLGFGAEKNNPIVKMMMDSYDDLTFVKEDGSYDLLPCPIRNTESIRHLFPDSFSAARIIRLPDAVFYPAEYFCPLAADGSVMKKTKNTYSVHWFSATWLTEEEHIVHEYRVFKNKCEKKLGKKIGGYAARFVYLFRPAERKIIRKY